MLASARLDCIRVSGCIVIRFLIATVALLGAAHAQTPSPGIGTTTDGARRPPEQSGAPASSPVLFPAANAEAPSEVCVKEFATLREEAVARGKLIKDASARHAGPDVTCKLIADFARSEIKMIKYLETNSTNCGISPQIGDQIRTGHKNTETMQTKVCNAAQQARGISEPSGPVGDFPQLDRR